MNDPTAPGLAMDHALLVLLQRHRRVLLTGAPGTGKTTLAARAARALEDQGRVCYCISADPGRPGFGPPGAVSLGAWYRGRWRAYLVEALCTLDAARFRLPLITAVQRLLARASPPGPLFVDAPGVVRGVAGAELLIALADVSTAEALAVLRPAGTPVPLAEECRALGVEMAVLAADPQARRPGQRARGRQRTTLWDTYLDGTCEQDLDLGALPVIGTPPPRTASEAWTGRQAGLLDARGHTLVMGEVIALEGNRLRVQAPVPGSPTCAVLIRDARRDDNGLLATAPRHTTYITQAPAPPEPASRAEPPGAHTGPRPTVRTGVASATLMNGVFDDPLLHIRLRHQRRSLLFDLGETTRLPARTAHQISDVFISHAHFDHIGGFLWLLRYRIGELPPCRVYGPPGLARNVAGLVQGILWDRVGSRAPRFDVTEVHDDRLLRYRITAGRSTPEHLGTLSAPDGLLLDESGFRVRTAVLDHQGTPVLAFALEPSRQVNVRKERLTARGWQPGQWLGQLRRRVLADDMDATIHLPDGSIWPVDKLAQELLLMRPGPRLVYATDLADKPDNRRRLTALARDAHTLICEAPFLEQESEQAIRTGHLTARACGEIAAAAGVGQLIPFHFSRRHADHPEDIYAEILPVCPQVVIPPELRP